MILLDISLQEKFQLVVNNLLKNLAQLLKRKMKL
jgi:hypothetical protein